MSKEMTDKKFFFFTYNDLSKISDSAEVWWKYKSKASCKLWEN